MSWYCHPDTLILAGASGAADRVAGKPKKGSMPSQEWYRAFVAAYREDAVRLECIWNLDEFLDRYADKIGPDK